MKKFTYKGIEYKKGDKVICKIDDTLIRGKLSINDYDETDDSWVSCHICHDNSTYDGDHAPNKFGYKYSWSFGIDLKEADPFSGSDTIIICHDIESKEKENFNSSDEFENFLSTKELEIVTILLEREFVFKQYNKIEISEKKGYVKLTDTTKNRFVDIRFGRFLNTLFTTTKDSFNLDFNYTNRDIENLYNAFVSYQNNDCIEFVELKGEEILEAYKSENYLYQKSTLGGSCMTDKTEYLKLYTSNPDIVSLLVIKTYGKIVSRCLLWNTDQGKVMDNRYTCFDWVNSKFENILKENNYICNSSLEQYPKCRKINIRLENFKDFLDIEYPYVDTFKFFNIVEGFLTNTISENMYALYTNKEKEEFIQLTRSNGESEKL